MAKYRVARNLIYDKETISIKRDKIIEKQFGLTIINNNWQALLLP